MNSALGFALISLVFAGLTDVAFKRYARIERSRGIYVAGMGAVWGVLQAVYFLVADVTLDWDIRTIGYGLASGLFVSVANLCLIESMTHINVSLASTVYRLNTIGVVIMAIVLLSEPLSMVKVTGVVLGVAAVLMLYDPSSIEGRAKLLVSLFWLAVLASFLRSCFGIITKFAALEGLNLPSVLFFNTGVWVVAGLAYAHLREGRIRITRIKVGYSIISGVLIFGVANSLALALKMGDASVVVPVANMSFLVALGLSACLGMEQLDWRKLSAMLLSVLAIVSLSQA